MSEIFNSNRFAKYFVTDLKSAWNNFGISFILFCSVPVILSLLCGLWTISLTSSHNWVSIPFSVRCGFFACTTLAMMVTICTKLYGFVTDKKQGSNFLLVPVSTLEKTISMILIVILFGVIGFFTCYLGLDAIICLIDRGCGESIIGSLFSLDEMQLDVIDIVSMKSIIIWTIVTEAICTYLVFLLGAVVFKKSKAAKTILTIIAFSAIIGSLASAVVPSLAEHFQLGLDEAQLIETARNLVYSGIIINIVFSIGLAVAVFFRIKTLKH